MQMSSNIQDVPQGVWTQITTTDKNGEVRHLFGESEVLYTESTAQPVGHNEDTPTSRTTSQREMFKYESIDAMEFLWAYAITGDVRLTVTETCLPNLITTFTEAATISGSKFTQVQEFIVDINTPLYVLYELPPGVELTAELLRRHFKSDSNGADMLVLWDYDASTATKTPLVSFNENNEYRGVKDAVFEISLLNPSTLATTTGVRTLTGAATIISDGIIRESSFISASGVGSNTTGDVDPALGFRRYEDGTGYLFKVVSRGDANKISVGYTWVESGC